MNTMVPSKTSDTYGQTSLQDGTGVLYTILEPLERSIFFSKEKKKNTVGLNSKGCESQVCSVIQTHWTTSVLCTECLVKYLFGLNSLLHLCEINTTDLNCRSQQELSFVWASNL